MEATGHGTFGEHPQTPGAETTDPDYVMVSIKFNGLQWYKAGFRLKGNSSLNTSWRNGIYKLPFRLDFDKFEEVYPQIKDQHFYGFNELSFSPGAKDPSLIREKICSDLFREGGVPSAETAFYKVYIDFGEGKKYCGVYTVVEVIDDTMIKTQFGNDDGNIYKPESNLKSFIESEFEKKNNEDEADYSDVNSFIQNLNSSLRTSDPELWRNHLEETFNVDHFIRWLALNNTMQNWDAYGKLAHNYYLYNHPELKLTWIPWDNNESLSNTHQPSGQFSMPEVKASEWPLIRYVIDDPVYNEKYKAYIGAFADDVFIEEEIYERLDYYHNLISPYVVGPKETEVLPYTQLQSENAFQSELQQLKIHVRQRLQAVDLYLN
jgi:spore coat protein CotH